ncbi:MAG: crossover junction endodeoxyribonuclease RuvC, partial [Chloroflexota bacterium]|nr:crossover junction endodeoxyribonuclease RuvC [Chloroflexota bacterium]
MRVIGIDPGTASTGYGLIDSAPSGDSAVAFGVISTPPDQALETRLLSIYQQLDRLMEDFKPDACAVEELFFGRNTRSAFSVAHARGAALLAAAQHGLSVAVYRPIQ